MSVKGLDLINRDGKVICHVRIVHAQPDEDVIVTIPEVVREHVAQIRVVMEP